MLIALASCSDLFDWEVDDRPLQRALGARGVAFEQPAWDDPEVDWQRYSAVLVRTTWDYVDKHAAFEAWVTELGARVPLFNSAEILRWNTRKTYLRDLEEQGVSVVPTAYVTEPTELAEILEERGWTRAFLKPVVGASASGTRRLEGAPSAEDQAHLDALVASGGAMVQPYRATVEQVGERSLLMVEGALSHAVQKIPLAGDYRVQDDHGATDFATEARPDEVLQAERALAAIEARFGQRPLYARADFLEGPGGPELCELELVEPSLFLRHGFATADRLADALLARLGQPSPTVRPLPRSRTKAVVFDLDGTLLDSAAVVVQTLNTARAEHGCGPLDAAHIRQGIGLPLRQMVGMLGTSDEDADAITASYRRLYLKIAASHEAMFAGTLELLVDLRQGGALLGIATGKSQRGATNATARHRLGHWVQAAHGILPGTPGKPHPDVLLRALEDLGVAAEDAVFVGDTTYDVEVGRGAGVPVIGVSWGVHPTASLEAAGAIEVVHEVAQLRELLLA